MGLLAKGGRGFHLILALTASVQHLVHAQGNWYEQKVITFIVKLLFELKLNGTPVSGLHIACIFLLCTYV